MADGLNFGILDPSIIRQRPNALAGLNDAANNYANMLAKKQQLDQTKQEYAFNQLKMQDYQKTRADEEATNAIYAGAVDPATGAIDYSKLNAGMASGGFGTKIPEINKQQQAQALAALQAKELKTKIYSSQQDFEDKAIRGLADNSSDENIKAFAQDSVIHGFHTPEEAQAVADKLMSIPPDQRKTIFSRRGAAAEASPKPSDLATLQNEMNALAPNDPRRAAYADAITKATTTTDAAIQEYNLAKSQGYTGSILDYKRELAKAGRNTVSATTIMPKQENEFQKELGKDQATAVLANKTKAEDAAKMLATNKIATNLLDKGMLTGTGADFFTNLNQGLKLGGLDFGYGDAAANSQAYGALMASNTASIIKSFGSGTGLSDADREYALSAAGGKINMDEKAIRKIININSRAAQNVITKHNKNVEGIKTNIPLNVNVEDYTAGIPDAKDTISKKDAKTLAHIFGY